MGSLISVIKTLAIPAVISLILFLLSTHIVIPFYRRNYARYSQYLPLDSISSGISTRTESLRERLGRSLAALARRTTIGRRLLMESATRSVDGDDDDDDDDEELTVLDAAVLGRMPRGQDHVRRLSRDLEEGFMDDSDDSS